jgi:ketosteroid isomerase-like protein
MDEARNTQIVKDAYAAFGRGDIPALLATLDPGIEWTAVVGSKTPTSGTRHGHAGVSEFFQQLAASMEFQTFEPREFVAQGDKVVALGHYVGRAKATGRTYNSDWVMIFTIRNGLATRFVEFADSAGINAAFEGAYETT